VKSKVGPNASASNTGLTPNATSPASGQARVSWTATYDQDNVNLNYKLVRDGNTASPVYQVNQISKFWIRPSMSFTESGLAPGSTHSYRLYVTDPDGNQVSRLSNTVTIRTAGNQAPIASFTATTSGLAAAVDGRASSDPDGTIASYAWNFGDSATATGSTSSHTYAVAGTYTIRLTVTDNKGTTGTTTRSVTVPAGSTLARDAFERAVSNGWGAADVGGAWTGSGVTSAYSVAAGTGQILDSPGVTKAQTLNGVSRTGTDTTVTFTTDVAPTGGGIQVSAIGRVVGSTDYSGRATLSSSGGVQLSLLQGSTVLQTVVVSGLTYAAGQQLTLRVQVYGASPTTVRAKLWRTGQAEQAAWQASVTDSTAALQTAGAIGLRTYLSASATTPTVIVKFDNYVVNVAP
ncbi:MAG: trimeric autotransporter adhesin, partial [Microbacteriaceae bacterium]|nr:trimeric autotransporter adhesin [Microbacteriaceae bacterium]